MEKQLIKTEDIVAMLSDINMQLENLEERMELVITEERNSLFQKQGDSIRTLENKYAILENAAPNEIKNTVPFSKIKMNFQTEPKYGF